MKNGRDGGNEPLGDVVNHDLNGRRAALLVEGVDGCQVHHEFTHIYLLWFDSITLILREAVICFDFYYIRHI